MSRYHVRMQIDVRVQDYPRHYPEGAGPAECVQADVNRLLAERKICVLPSHISALVQEFRRVATARGARVTDTPAPDLFDAFGTYTLAVANGSGWSCMLVCVADQSWGVSVVIPRGPY
jgi:hypothetical protein